jgi:poly(3-hydroxybutyrate) depolymerase
MKIAAFLAVASALLGVGCTASPRLAGMAADPAADPSVGTAAGQYNSVLGSYQHREPVDPKNWKQLNNDLLPKGNKP